MGFVLAIDGRAPGMPARVPFGEDGLVTGQNMDS